MSETIIQTKNLSKDYGNGRGIFNIDLSIQKGEIFGYVGTNGSGKTTTIRCMMGFIQPDSGSVSVLGQDAWSTAPTIMKNVSYIPGEIAFPSVSTGTAFLKLQADYLGITDDSYMKHLIDVLQLDPSANLKRMSKGMKQKTAIVAALMGDKDILILDEPTTGLDPLMREVFLDLIRGEKAKGRTIFMSSHIFEEIEEVCDRVAMIKDGALVDIATLSQLRHSGTKTFTISFFSAEDAAHFANQTRFSTTLDGSVCQVSFPIENTKSFLAALQNHSIKHLHENKPTLQEHFMQVYQRGAMQQ